MESSLRDRITEILEKNPRIYDFIIKIMRKCISKQDFLYSFLNAYSSAKKKKIRFIQIGANDGLRKDFIREFIIRDHWQGVLVEPLPDIFDLLKRNYAYLNRANLIYVNAAVFNDSKDHVLLYTPSRSLLHKLPLPQRMALTRKASLNKEHLCRWMHKFIKDPVEMDKNIVSIRIPCISLNQLIAHYCDRSDINILVIDAEGSEFDILSNFDFTDTIPEVIIYENLHLGKQEDLLANLLKEQSYSLTRVNGNTIAELGSKLCDA